MTFLPSTSLVLKYKKKFYTKFTRNEPKISIVVCMSRMFAFMSAVVTV